MGECRNYEKNMQACNCTYEPCSRKGMCCECVAYHRGMGQIPACFFDKKGEASYDRSISNFVRLNK
ncbi:MAG: DUF6485 family protein [Candidatus Omnitrophota bacterium]